MFTRAATGPFPVPVESITPLTPYLLKTHSNIVLLFMPRSPKWSLPFRFSNQSIFLLTLELISWIRNLSDGPIIIYIQFGIMLVCFMIFFIKFHILMIYVGNRILFLLHNISNNWSLKIITITSTLPVSFAITVIPWLSSCHSRCRGMSVFDQIFLSPPVRISLILVFFFFVSHFVLIYVTTTSVITRIVTPVFMTTVC
jgi:hypothetical protein